MVGGNKMATRYKIANENKMATMTSSKIASAPPPPPVLVLGAPKSSTVEVVRMRRRKLAYLTYSLLSSPLSKDKAGEFHSLPVSPTSDPTYHIHSAKTIDSELRCQTVSPDFVIIGFSGLPLTMVANLKTYSSQNFAQPSKTKEVSDCIYQTAKGYRHAKGRRDKLKFGNPWSRALPKICAYYAYANELNTGSPFHTSGCNLTSIDALQADATIASDSVGAIQTPYIQTTQDPWLKKYIPLLNLPSPFLQGNTKKKVLKSRKVGQPNHCYAPSDARGARTIRGLTALCKGGGGFTNLDPPLHPSRPARGPVTADLAGVTAPPHPCWRSRRHGVMRENILGTRTLDATRHLEKFLSDGLRHYECRRDWRVGSLWVKAIWPSAVTSEVKCGEEHRCRDGRRWRTRCLWSERTRGRETRRVKATVHEGARRTLENCRLVGPGLKQDIRLWTADSCGTGCSHFIHNGCQRHVERLWRGHDLLRTAGESQSLGATLQNEVCRRVASCRRSYEIRCAAGNIVRLPRLLVARIAGLPQHAAVKVQIQLRVRAGDKRPPCVKLGSQHSVAFVSRPSVSQPLEAGAAVGVRLDCSPPTKANWVQSPVGSSWILWESCRTTPLVGGFSRRSPVSPTLSLRRCSILASIKLTGSQYLAVNETPKSLHSLTPRGTEAIILTLRQFGVPFWRTQLHVIRVAEAAALTGRGGSCRLASSRSLAIQASVITGHSQGYSRAVYWHGAGRSEEIRAVLNIEVLRDDEGEARYGVTPECKGGGNGRFPRIARRPAASSGTIPTRENPAGGRKRGGGGDTAGNRSRTSVGVE
ncbi:hypothetical protein PR048_010106 [Dryococelus australis]|uniref:Uncharacterized protein n=1 Tax=Dryococelus australis TaxID=614101 RepID=A0ABQ9I1R9_9NEOP|nr:hypothetical protein PR048_010106 [Dryococelus australis]